MMRMQLWLLPLAPLAGAAALIAASRVPWRHGRAALGALAAGTMVVTLALALWAAARTPWAPWPWWGPRFEPGLAVAGVSRVIVVLVPVIAMPVLLYAVASERLDGAGARGGGALARLLALLVAFTGVMELLVLADDFLTLVIAWELSGACSWALIAHEWRDRAKPRAALQAFLTTRAGDLGLYVAAAAAVAATGSVRFEALAGVRGPALDVVAAGVLVASAAKSAQLPFSPWLFSAMAGPTPASALLHSATMVAAGAYALARLAPALTPTGWFGPAVAGLGLATALAGGIVALLQSDLKRALAGSTSAQYGLMFVAIGAGATGAAGVHLVTHAAFKALLFLGAGVALHAAGTLDLGRLRLGTALPRVALLVGVGALALAAVPPLGGAYSKEAILAAAAHGPGGSPWLAGGVLAAGFLSALYAGRLYLLAFGPKAGQGTRPAPAGAVQHPGGAEVASLAVLATLSVLLGFLWLPGVGALAARLTGGRLAGGTTLELLASLGPIAAAAVVCRLLWRRGVLLTLGLAAAIRDPAAAWLGIPAAARRLVVDPGLAVARTLAAADDRVIDAGVRAAARIGGVASRALAWWGERGVDGIVAGLARATAAAARASGVADDRGVDAAVEGVARQVGVVGRQSRRLQTGLAHHYYVIVAVGALIIIAAAAFIP